MIASLTFLLCMIVMGIPAAIIFIQFTLITRWVEPLFHVTQSMVRISLWMAGVRIAVEGREKIPTGKACIFMANHVSNLDPPCMITRLPGRTSAFMKRSLLKLPIAGYAFKLGEFIAVGRNGSAIEAQKSVEQAKNLLARGIHITTFVEGTRSKDGRMLPFKKGPFYMAKESGALCIPVSIHGTESMMQKGSMRLIPGTAHVIFHDPIDPADFATRQELMNAVRASIASGLPEWMRA